MKITPTLLLILDGWGLAPAGPGNAASLANTPTLSELLGLPRATLLCSGREVGLPRGYMGNSEVGHMNIGAGRIVYQDMTRIDLAVEEHALEHNPVLLKTLSATAASGGRLHLMGLLSDGGVHSHIQHLLALIDLAASQNVPVAVHAFMDGRDTSPTSGIGFIKTLQAKLAQSKAGVLASIIGRYYAMDRDKRWDRTQKAWEALAHGQGELIADPIAAMDAAYKADETDEFIKPRLLVQPDGQALSIKDNDAVFFFNFRADRARQITRCLYDDSFAEFDRGQRPKLAGLATMTPYDSSMPLPAAFEKDELHNGLGQIASEAGLKQLRIAETEKYAHVTYFFNGGREEPFAGEDRILVNSPRDVATYDLKPEMSAREVTAKLLEAWQSGKYDFVVCNLANTDMVGHTGVIPAGIKACEVVNECVAKIRQAVAEREGILLVTADHGNIEEMLTPDGKPQTAHSKNPVPLILLEPGQPRKLLPNGKLGDIAPTVLTLWGLPIPAEMTGQNLAEKP